MTSLDANRIQETIPHRFPFLFVDRITELNDKSARGIKNVTISEPFFEGQVCEQPVMPPLLALEVMAQVGAVLVLTKLGVRGKLPYLLAIDKARFLKSIHPGDRLDIEVTIRNFHRNHGKLRGEITVDGELVAETVMTFAMLEEPDNLRSPSKAPDERPLQRPIPA